MNASVLVAIDRLLPMNDFAAMLGYRSRTSIYKHLKHDANFPRPVIRGRSVLFLESEALSYIKKLADDRGGQTQTAQQQPVRERVRRMVEQRQAKVFKGAA